MTEQRHAALGIHAGSAMEDGDAAELLKRRQILRRTRVLTVVVLILLAIGAGRTIMSRMANARLLEAGASEQAAQYVKTTMPKSSAVGQDVVLPGTLQGFVQAPISASSSPLATRLPMSLVQRFR